MAGSFGPVNDRYDLIEIVGSGGMGVVYRGRDRVLGRTVAVKMIRQELAGEEFIRRFEREAAILARLRSPYIVVVYDYGKHADEFFMVTDFLKEGDLAGWLQQHGTMPAADAVPLMAKLAEGLADAHDLGVLHRDIKPANTLLWSRGGRLQPVLADFGIAVTSDLTLTKTGAVVGSPLYMAPERHLGQPATAASDIYSMGCLLYALLTGQPPYWGTEFQAANAHVSSPIPKLPPELPFAAEIDEVIAACMAKRPEERIKSADDLAAVLRQLSDQMAVPVTVDVPVPDGAAAVPGTPGGTTVMSPTDPPPMDRPSRTSERPQPPPRRRAVPVVAAVIAVVMLIGLGGLWLAQAGEDEPEEDSAGPRSSPSGPASDDPSPPSKPRRPAVDVEPGDLEVVFVAAVPPGADGVRFELERKAQGWSTTRPRLAVPTDAGDEKRCQTFRLVAVNDGGRTPGAERRECGRSRPPNLEMIPVDADCAYSALDTCTYFQIVVEGFAANDSVTVHCSLTDPEAVQDSAQRVVFTNDDGKGAVETHNDAGDVWPGAFRLDDDNDRMYCSAGDKVWSINLADLRASIGR